MTPQDIAAAAGSCCCRCPRSIGDTGRFVTRSASFMLRLLGEHPAVGWPPRALNGQGLPSLALLVLMAEALGVSESCIIRYPPVWHRILQDIEGTGE